MYPQAHCISSASPLTPIFPFVVRPSSCAASCSEYAYLMETRRTIPGMDDAKEFGNLKESMSRVEINKDDQVRTKSLGVYNMLVSSQRQSKHHVHRMIHLVLAHVPPNFNKVLQPTHEKLLIVNSAS